MFDNQTPDLPKIPGEYVLENVFQIDVNRSKWVDLAVIFSMIIIYRIIFFIMIKVNEDVTPWLRGYVASRKLRHKTNLEKQRSARELSSRAPSLKGYVAEAGCSSGSTS